MKPISVFFLLFFILTSFAQGQQTDPEVIQQAIREKTLIFEARQATGFRGRMIQIDPGYTLIVSPRRVIGSLPFFGRSFQGMPGTSDVGMKFEFEEYDYSVRPKKRGGWEITLRPKGNSEVSALYLTVQMTGTASLRIISNNRNGMSYMGFIQK